jgi:predicted nucleic acid-binding protein
MILADTSVWVDHFRKKDHALSQELARNNIRMHPFVVTELLLGNLPDRSNTLALLDQLPKVLVANPYEVRRMIEAHSLFQRGIGFVDVHLLAATLITAGTTLWSRDSKLKNTAAALGIAAGLS